MAEILDGKRTAAHLRKEIQRTIKEKGLSPHLIVFLAHPHPASETYVKNKMKACAEVGITTTLIDEPCTTERELLSRLAPYAADRAVDGILVQLPLHPAIDQRHILHAVPPEKDVDGLHPENLGKLVSGDTSGFIPCTPLGISLLLEAYGISTVGKHVVIVGRGPTVGKPLALLLSQKGRDATVTIAHSATRHLSKICASADIIVAAAGRPRLITPSMVHETTVVIDVGINRNGSLIQGDVDPAVYALCAAYSPVPGGIGPMTIASLLQNTLHSCLKRYEKSSS